MRPLVDRVAEHQYAMEEVQAAFALGEFVSALKEEAKNQAMLKNGGAHNAPAIGGQLSLGLKIKSTSNSSFYIFAFGPFSAVSTPIFASKA